MNGEVYNQLILSVDMHLHETKTFIPISSNFALYALQWLGPSGQWIGIVERFVDEVASKIIG